MTAPEFTDEVVTKALVRYVDVPGVPGEFAVITLDNGFDHTRPNTFGPAGLAALDAAVTEIEAHTPQVAAIALTGKPFIFAVGADISGVGLLATREQGLEMGRLGHRVFARFKNSTVPTFAFVNGAVMGGGLELALHCHYRTLAKKAAAIAFPEVFLGLVPAWGGTQLLAPLVGPDAAVKVIVENALNTNKMLSPKQAADLGIADALLDDADFLAQSLIWAAGVVNGTTTVARNDHSADDWDGPIARGKSFTDAKTSGQAPAAYRALDLIAQSRTTEFAAGTAAEDEALADLLMGDELRGSLYSFDLVNRRAKRPAGAPDKALARKITKVGVVGAGLMASQLALLFARKLQVPVVLTDLDQDRLDKGVAYVHNELDQQLAKGRLNQDKANRLKALVSGSLTKDAFADADLVIEAVFEEIKIKKTVFAEVEEYVGPEAILATNTSSLSITDMAADLKHPERVVGLHFFNPVAVMPLLEVIRAEQTDDATLATGFAVGKALGKTTIGVKDSPSFVANRLLGRFMGEISKVVDEGTPMEVADGSVAGIAPMPPFILLGLVGPAIALHNSETLHGAFGDRFYVSENLRKIVAAKRQAIYAGTLSDTGKPVLDAEIAAFFEVAEPPVVLTADEVRERVLSALAEEAQLILDEGVVSAAQDLDLAMITGAGFSFWNGGITPLLDRSGLAEKVNGKRFLDRGIASVPA
jgi:3-hydroxyacyl-CoA dehydrogenase/enoyl-CoA hydratase/carnithine racemase